MKPKKQLRYLFDKQIIEADNRQTLHSMDLLLTVVSTTPKFTVTDGINSADLLYEPADVPEDNSKKGKHTKATHSGIKLMPKSLYIFKNCQMKIEAGDEDSIKVSLMAKGAELVMPLFSEFPEKEIKPIESEFIPSEKDIVRRRVG
jgi:hypothetical protein